MKTPEELNALKEEFEALNAKLAELSEEDLEQVSGGLRVVTCPKDYNDWYAAYNFCTQPEKCWFKCPFGIENRHHG